MPKHDLSPDDPNTTFGDMAAELGAISHHSTPGEKLFVNRVLELLSLEEAEAASVVARYPGTFNPLLNVLADVMAKQAMGDAIIQGSLAYLHPNDLPARVKRFIPVDIYTESANRTVELNEAVAYLRILFRVLGFRLSVHPGIAFSSVHRRAAIETAPMTAAELAVLERRLAAVLRNFEGLTECAGAGSDNCSEDLELRKTIAEVLKLHAETEKTQAETEKILAEKAKIRAERISAVVDAFNKLGNAILKIAAGVSLVIGATTVTSSRADTPEQARIIHVQKTTRRDNIRRLAEFLEELDAQAKDSEKTAGADE